MIIKNIFGARDVILFEMRYKRYRCFEILTYQV